MSQSDIINSRQIQWFPGHMTKTLKLKTLRFQFSNGSSFLPALGPRSTAQPLSSRAIKRKTSARQRG